MNSLALQAVVDRWTTMSNEAAQAQNRQTGNSWFGVLMEIYRVNEPYIQEVVDASRRILQIVLDGLVPGDHLKHTPVRSCFRILSGMIFILKVFSYQYHYGYGYGRKLTLIDIHTGCQRRRRPCVVGPPGSSRGSSANQRRRRCTPEPCHFTITRAPHDKHPHAVPTVCTHRPRSRRREQPRSVQAGIAYSWPSR